MAEHAPDTHPQDPHQAAMFEVSNTAGAPQLEVAPEALPPAPEAPVEQPRVKMMFVHGEDKHSKPVHIPRDADKQVEWVNSPYNSFTLDRNQFRALSPEARNAYATAQLQRAQEQAAPTGPRIEDRLGDARADEEAQAKLMAEEARVKAENARDALNGTDKPHAPEPEAQTPVPEPQQKLLADRIDPNQMDRLDALAEGAVINGNREHFDQVAEELGVTEAERQALLDIATKTTATQRAQRHTADQIATQPETPDSSGASGERASSVKLEDLSFSEKIAVADQIMSEGRKAHSAGDHAVANKLEAQMDTIFSSLSPDEQQAFMDRYRPTTLPESTPAPEQSPPEPEQAAPKISPTERLYQDFVAGKLSEADKRVLATSLARRAETAHANGEPVGEMIMRIREVYNTMDDEGKNQFNAQFGPHPSFEPPKPQLRTYKEVIQGMSFEERRDEAVHFMTAAHDARARGREDVAQEYFDRVQDIYETFTPDEADAWQDFRNANPLAGNPPQPGNADTNTGRTETPADRDKRIRDAFLMGEEATLTPDERVELMLALTDEGDNVGANELYNKGMTKQEREEFRRRQALRGNGNTPQEPEAGDQPEPVDIEVDDFTLMSKSGRYSTLNRIADYAHDLMDKDADPRLIDVVWEQFDELYDTLTPKFRLARQLLL